jgi:type II secretory pathway pseudopilin PulG
MKIRTKNKRLLGVRGFSLIEILLAIGIFAFTIVAIIAMLGSTSQATSEVLNTVNASQIADSVRTELENLGYDNLIASTNGADPLELFGTKDAARVVVKSNANRDPDDEPPGINERDRFFRIEVERLGSNGSSLVFRNDFTSDANAAQLPVTVRVYWPHNIPLGSSSSAFREVEAAKQSIAIFNVSIPRTVR